MHARLSRPTLTPQYPLAQQEGQETIDSRSALALPERTIDGAFALTPLVPSLRKDNIVK